MQTRTTCYDCGAAYSVDERKRCECGEPLWFPIEEADLDLSRPSKRTGMWRYEDVLPVSAPTGIGSGAGGTPLVRARRLDDYTGCRLFVKDEAANPTGSFKDRGSAVGVAYAAERGPEWMGTVSHGNMAMSMSAHAAGSDLDCVVLVPAHIPPSG